LKGWRTLVAVREGNVLVNPTGTPVLATGGTGDVLTGAIAAFVARGLPPWRAAAGAAYVHGLAGRRCEERMGEGTTAGDVAEALAEVIREEQEAWR
jgi:NAD(P)H-hydrate repair Nnr-like enzyme with NAD(P)H-hydrate dehydratase domain